MALIPKRTKILRALTTHLETISYTSYTGDEINLSGAVSRGRSVYGEEAPITYLAIIEKPRQLAGDGGGEQNTTRNDTWELFIQGFAANDSTHPLDPAYELLAYVEQRMSRILAETKSGNRGGEYPNEYFLGLKDIIKSIGFIIPIVRPPDNDVSDTAYFFMPVSIGLVTDMTSPFIEET